MTVIPEKNLRQSERMVDCRLRLGCRDAMDFYKKYSQNGQLFSYPKYQKHERGERPLNEKSAMTYAKIFNVNWMWLLYGTEDLTEQTVSLDVVDTVACCGNGRVNFDSHIIGQQMLSLKAFHQITLIHPKNIKILKVVGDSMEPTISNNDFVWVDISCKTPTGDGIYMFCIGDRLVIKRVQINPFDNSLKILSDNPKYEPITAERYQDVQTLGRIISFTKMIG